MRLMVVAGEASGDKHAANLVKAIRSLDSNRHWDVFGAGGEEMRAAGVHTLVDARDLSIMGIVEVAMALGKFLDAFRKLRAAARDRRPHMIVLVDWPEFNLRLARRLKRDGHRIVYYISPQVWAWRSGRVSSIKRDVERMLVILPFERDFYANAGVNVDYVGHPLLDSVTVTSSREAFCRRYGLAPGQAIVAILPGSRQSELKFIIPPMYAAVRRIIETRPEIQFVLPLASTVSAEEVEAISEVPATLRILSDETYNAIGAADVTVAASGTATLETAIIGTPLIVVYRASALNWRLLYPLVRTKFVGMPNLIAGRSIVPELLQEDLNPDRLAVEITSLLDDPDRRAQQRADLCEVREKLGTEHASHRAAAKIAELLGIL